MDRRGGALNGARSIDLTRGKRENLKGRNYKRARLDNTRVVGLKVKTMTCSPQKEFLILLLHDFSKPFVLF